MENKSDLDINKDILSPTSDIAELDTTERKEFLIETNFKGLRKSYFLNPKAIPLKVGEFIIVDFENGEDMGVVSGIVGKQLKRENIDIEGNIIRKSNQIDVRRLNENRKIENNILIHARKQAKLHGLEMKFIDIEYKFDRKKLVFFFTADGRVDFRELVKTFAGEYKTRIELRQIGVLDEAQKVEASIVTSGNISIQILDKIALSEIPEPELTDIPPQILSGLIRALRARIN